jgi:hypothetical protein
MPGLKQRIFGRRSSGTPRQERSSRSLSSPFKRKRRAWGKKAQVAAPGALPEATTAAEPLAQPQQAQADAPAAAATAGKASFRERGRLRRRLRYLRRTRELAYRDIGGLIFDMRRFNRSRQDLLDAKLGALGSVDQELRALERVLDDRRPIHELHEAGISSCARCGALHDSEANFCPHCGLQLGGSRPMGEVGGAIAAPPQVPPPAAAAALAPPATTSSQQPTESFRPPDVPPDER